MPPSNSTWNASSKLLVHAWARDSLKHSASLPIVTVASSSVDCPTWSVNGASGVTFTPSLANRSSRTDSAVDASVGCVFVTTTLM